MPAKLLNKLRKKHRILASRNAYRNAVSLIYKLISFYPPYKGSPKLRSVGLYNTSFYFLLSRKFFFHGFFIIAYFKSTEPCLKDIAYG